MKMKQLTAIILCLCFCCSCACADNGESFFDGIGNWVNQAWDDSSKWVEQAWKDAPAWLEATWGDATKWIEQAWSEASPILNDIWGDVSTWTSETYESVSGSVSAWWAETFVKVTEAKDYAWEWIKNVSSDVSDKISEKYQEVETLIRNGSVSEEAALERIYIELLKKLGLDDDEITKVMETIRAYAESKGISVVSLEKMLLPYMVMLCEDSSRNGDEPIPAVSAAQYLIGIMETEDIETEAQVQELVEQLRIMLNRQ